MSGGRMTYINDALVNNICNHIASGVPQGHSARLCGISESSFYKWMQRGRREESGEYHDFVKKVELAKSRAIANRVSKIAEAGDNGDWKAHAWWLSRMDHDNFGDKRDIKVDAEVESKTNFNELFNQGIVNSIVNDSAVNKSDDESDDKPEPESESE